MHGTSIQSLVVRVRRFIDDSAAFVPSEDDFSTLACELFRFQAQANPVIRKFAAAKCVDANSIREWRDIPALPLTAFKEFEVSCLPQAGRSTWFESSGTTGERRSRHFHNPETLSVYARSLEGPFARHVKPEETPVFLSLTPDGRAAPHSSLVHMLEVVGKQHPGRARSASEPSPRLEHGQDFPKLDVSSRDGGFGETALPAKVFAGHLDHSGGWVVDMDKVRGVLNGAIKAGQPALVCGTAFQFVQLMDALPCALKLPPGSRAMETGGYKGRSRELTREELHAGIGSMLGVRQDHIVREYGMSELSSQAYDRVCGCPEAGFQFPPWVRFRLVSPETGREVEDGEAGLLQICDLANIGSAIMIETADLAVASGGTFQLLGRAAFAEPKGCSLLSAA